jgi:hypothetical protein
VIWVELQRSSRRNFALYLRNWLGQSRVLINVCIDSHPVVACEVLASCGLGGFRSCPRCIIPDRYFWLSLIRCWFFARFTSGFRSRRHRTGLIPVFWAAFKAVVSFDFFLSCSYTVLHHWRCHSKLQVHNSASLGAYCGAPGVTHHRESEKKSFQ